MVKRSRTVRACARARVCVCVCVCVCCTPGRGEPLRLRVRAARRELAVAAVGEDPRLRTVPVQHARAAPARLARSHPRARARRRRKRRRRPATRATSLGRAGVHAVGGPTGKGPRKVACQCPWGARPLLAPCAEGRLYSPQHVSTSQFMPAPKDAKPYAQPRSCIGGCDCPCASSQRASYFADVSFAPHSLLLLIHPRASTPRSCPAGAC